MKRFLDLADFTREEILDLLALAQSLQERPQPRALAGKILGLVFFNPSLRTLASFQAGMARLGGSSFVITPGQGTWQLETRLNAVMNGAAAEHIREGIPVLASYCDALGVRAFAEGKNLDEDLHEPLFGLIDDLCDKPLINLESAMNHPCQALADWRTMDELSIPSRAKFVLSWVYHPRALPLAVPAAVAAHGRDARHGSGRRAPGGLRPAAGDHGEGALGRRRRGRLGHRDRRSRRGARRGERALCQGMGQHPVLRRQPKPMRACARILRIGACASAWFARALPDAKLMHCLPVRRNVAVADEVLDGPRAVVRREAFNRLVVADGRSAPHAGLKGAHSFGRCP